jgi:phospholipid/cholesterol/gamma-HCH transport system substrate-binding protein
VTQSVPAGQRGPRRHSYTRPLAGLATVVVIVAVVAVALTQFRGGFTETVPVTVLSDRAGLMMNPGAKVKLHGAPVGTVASVEDNANGQAAIHLAIDPSRMRLLPANILVDIVATTAFGRIAAIAASRSPRDRAV